VGRCGCCWRPFEDGHWTIIILFLMTFWKRLLNVVMYSVHDLSSPRFCPSPSEYPVEPFSSVTYICVEGTIPFSP
jgi:hypothetical protein